MKKSLLSVALVLGLALSAQADITSIVTSPAGSNEDVQFNKNRRFGADPGLFTYSTTTHKLSSPWVQTSTMTLNGVQYTFPPSCVSGGFWRYDGVGITCETPTTVSTSTGVALGILDGGVTIVNTVSSITFNGSQFIVSLVGSTTASIALDPSVVSLLGSSIDLGSEVTGSLPAASIAAGSLGASVMASSVAVNSVPSNSIVSLVGSKVTGDIPGNAAGITGTVNVDQVVGAVSVYPATSTIILNSGIRGSGFNATTSSLTVTGADGLKVSYGLTATTVTVTGSTISLAGVSYYLPTTGGSAGQVLTTSGGTTASTLTWTSAGSGDITDVNAGYGLTGGGTSGGVTLNLSPTTTSYIRNTETLQSGATFYVSSGTVNTYLNVGSYVDGNGMQIRGGTSNTEHTMLKINNGNTSSGNKFNIDFTEGSGYAPIVKLQAHDNSGVTGTTFRVYTSLAGSSYHTVAPFNVTGTDTVGNAGGSIGINVETPTAIVDILQPNAGSANNIPVLKVTPDDQNAGSLVIVKDAGGSNLFRVNRTSVSAEGVGGLISTYGIVGGSLTANDLTASQFVVTDSNKKLASSLNGSSLTSLTGANIATVIPSSVLPSTVAYTSSTNTWTAQQNYTRVVDYSSTTHISGSPGVSGQVFTSGGPGAVPSWQTPSATGGGDNLGNHISTKTLTVNYGVIGSTFSFSGPTPSTVTYNLAVGSLTVTGAGTMSVTENGQTGQLVIATGTPTSGQMVVAGSSYSIVSTPLRDALIAVDANGVAVSTTINLGATNVGGNLPTSKLNSGSGATSSTFWRGDGTWAAPAGSGDAVLSATQTWSGGNTLLGSTTFYGRVSLQNISTLTLTSAELDVSTINKVFQLRFADGTTQTTAATGSSSGSATDLVPGDTDYIQVRETLQSGATFYVSSGTIKNGLIANQFIPANSGGTVLGGYFGQVNANVGITGNNADIYLNPGTGKNTAIVAGSTLAFQTSGAQIGLQAPPYSLATNVLYTLPPLGSSGQYLQQSDSTGTLAWATVSASGGGDNFGSHTATQTVVAGYGIQATTITATGGVTAASATVTNLTASLPTKTNASKQLVSGTIGLSEMDNRATQTFIGRNTAGTGVPEELSVSTAKTMLNLTGTNSGDQTITLSGDATGSGTSGITVAVVDDSHAHTGSTLSAINGNTITTLIPSSVLPSTIAFITSTQTFTGYHNIVGSTTFSGAIYLSSSIVTVGQGAGTSGQVLQSQGNGAAPIWATYSGGGYATIADEASDLTQRTKLNFTGSGVSCADNAGSSRTDCTINAGAASAGGSSGNIQFNDGGSLGGLQGSSISGNTIIISTGGINSYKVVLSSTEVNVGSFTVNSGMLAFNNISTMTMTGMWNQNNEFLFNGKHGYDDQMIASSGTASGQAPKWGPIYTTIITTSNFTSTGNTPVNIPQLSYNLLAGATYQVSCTLIQRSTATAVGIGAGLFATSGSTVAASVRTIIAADGTAASWDGLLTSAGDSVIGTGVAAANSDVMTVIQGVVRVGTAGNLNVTSRAEGGGGQVTTQAGSTCEIDGKPTQ